MILKKFPLRQRVRAVTTTLSLILFPAFFYYLSPVIPIGGAQKGIVTGSLVIFALLFGSALVLGRGFCAYVCPAGALQDHVARGRSRRFPQRAFGWLTYVVWVAWLGMLAFFFRRAGGISGISFAFQTTSGLSVADRSSLIAYLMVVLVFFLLALLFGRRAACHTICWIAPFMVLGRKLGAMLRVPAVSVTSDPASCVDCRKCDGVCPMSLPVSRMHRNGVVSSSGCILCGNCVDVCPTGTLSLRWIRSRNVG